MNQSIESRRKPESLVRSIAAIGSTIFLALSLKIGAESFHARSIGSSMPNWKGGTMAYQDGMKLTAILALFAVVWCVVAVRPKSVTQRWARAEKAK